MVNSSKKLIFKGILLLILVFLLMHVVLFFTVPNTSYTKLLWKDIYKNSPFDIAIVGNSLVYCSANPEVFNSLLEKNTVVLGTPGQRIIDSYYSVKELLRTSNCKLVILQISYERLITSRGVRVSKTMMDYMKPSFTKAAYYFDAFPSDYKINALFPGLQMIGINSFKPLKMLETVKEKIYNPDDNIYSGNRFYKNNGFITFDEMSVYNQYAMGRINSRTIRFEFINPEALVYFKKLIDFCHSKGVMIVLVNWPYLPYSIKQINNYEEWHKYISNFAEENNVDFFDLNYSKSGDFNNNNSYYFDRIFHMNLVGANALSTSLAKVILALENDTYRKEDFFYNSFDELADSWNDVFGVWLEKDNETNELKAVSVIPPNRDVEYEFAFVLESGEYEVYRSYDENPMAETEKLPSGEYQIRVNARLMGSDEPFQQYNTIVYNN